MSSHNVASHQIEIHLHLPRPGRRIRLRLWHWMNHQYSDIQTILRDFAETAALIH